MKTTKAMNQLVLGLLLVLALSACSSDDGAVNTPDAQDMSQEEATLLAKSESIEATSFDMVEQLYISVEESEAKMFPDCATITTVYEGGQRSVTLDFGDGCTLASGDVAAGIVLISFVPDPGVSRTITFSFQDFSLNDNGISGGGELIRVRENENGNPQSNYNSGISIDVANSEIVIEREVDHQREWVAGVGTISWADNVFEVTGSGSTTLSTGFSRSHETLNPLVRLGNCRFFVSGEVALTRNDQEAVLDFGAGDCDNKAVLTYEGGSMEITLTK
ncbi:hypothetical protein [Croceiramulus getboli]|nr:hypothetical protein P8624_01440 [Flavobacteriaceae bacterium YJPT1-3]